MSTRKFHCWHFSEDAEIISNLVYATGVDTGVPTAQMNKTQEMQTLEPSLFSHTVDNNRWLSPTPKRSYELEVQLAQNILPSKHQKRKKKTQTVK